MMDVATAIDLARSAIPRGETMTLSRLFAVARVLANEVDRLREVVAVLKRDESGTQLRMSKACLIARREVFDSTLALLRKLPAGTRMDSNELQDIGDALRREFGL